MQHASLENGRWAELTLPQQMANIGSETSRVLKALELIDLTIEYGRTGTPSRSGAMLEELCRFRELFCEAFLSKNISELAAMNKYLDQFAAVN